MRDAWLVEACMRIGAVVKAAAAASGPQSAVDLCDGLHFSRELGGGLSHVPYALAALLDAYSALVLEVRSDEAREFLRAYLAAPFPQGLMPCTMPHA